ncbi:MAG TPA: DHA2 family efflux MFS transporter permease subunit, partial [Frankiaceae bacterium]|nr:DHA2 family efflux MFS transporter permease subunit [Frankiaceae bacterium]
MTDTVPRRAGPPGGGEAGPGLTHRQILVVMSGLMLGMLLAALDQTIVATALPTIAGDFRRADLLSWVVTSYLLTSTASTPLYGKASDLYGRKTVFQVAIVVFLAGSALCGLSQSMVQLVVFRGVQGLGAGGLISLALAIVGDVIPPRERGRYQGYFGAVFGASSVVGPLVGGFFVDHASWRWVFYVNLPLGAVALLVTNRVLRLPYLRRRAVLDWWGALLLVGGVSALLVATQSGGRDYPWGSWQVAALVAGGLVLLVAFVLRERVAPEPILPLELFGNDVFRVASLLSLITGAAMFGAIVFLPQYLQLVRGVSATVSGLLLLPLLAGLLVASIGSGRAISRIGRYKAFVVAGTAVLAAGLGLLSLIEAHTPEWETGLFMLVTGVGLGLFMQVLVLVTQNAVDVRHLGTATSAVTFLRTMGGAIGASAFGALLTARLRVELPRFVPGAAAHAGDHVNQLVTSPGAVAALPPLIREGVRQGYTHALATVFLVAVPVALLGFVVSLFLREVTLHSVSGLARGSSEQDRVPAADPPPGRPGWLQFKAADMQNVTFTKASRRRRGYDEQEVNAFLHDVKVEMAQLVAEQDALRKESAQLRRQLEEADAGAGEARRQMTQSHEQAVGLLAKAQQTADQYVAEAEQYSCTLVQDARQLY